jgi:hypothetical protein
MGIVQSFKRKAGRYFLDREDEIKRNKGGSNFATANHVALLYNDEDEAKFKKIKSYVKYLHEEHGIRKVMAFGFIDTDKKNVPAWHAHKLEFEYFTREDLNWHLKPSRDVRTFTDQEFDMLIDLTHQDCVPIKYVLAHSCAKMKVGRKGTVSEGHYDFLIDMKDEVSIDKFIDQVNFYLSNFKIQ